MKSIAAKSYAVLMRHKIFWVPPLVVCLLILVMLLVLTHSAPIHAPFMYTTF